MPTQTVTIKNRTYTFTPKTDPDMDGHDSRYIGDLANSRGDWAGWVFEVTNGNRILLGGVASRGFSRAETAALSTLTI